MPPRHLFYPTEREAKAVCLALREIIAPVVTYGKWDADKWYVEISAELAEMVRLCAIAFPRLDTRGMLETSIRNVIRKGDANEARRCGVA